MQWFAQGQRAVPIPSEQPLISQQDEGIQQQPASPSRAFDGADAQRPIAQHALQASQLPEASHPAFEGPADIAYLTALSRQTGIASSTLAQQIRLPMGSASPPGRLLQDASEDDSGTRGFAQQQRQLQPAASGPLTPRGQPFELGPPIRPMGAGADLRGTAGLQGFQASGHWHAALPSQGPLREAPEDRFPHNPALDPYLSSLHQSHQLMPAQAASHVPLPRREASTTHRPGPSVANQAAYNDALRMRLDSPLYASNQAAAAAAAAVEAAAAAAAEKSPRQPHATLTGTPRGMMGHSFPPDGFSAPPGHADEATPARHPLPESHSHGYLSPLGGPPDSRSTADAVMEAAVQAQFMERVRQQAMSDAAARQEAKFESRHASAKGAESSNDAHPQDGRQAVMPSQYPRRSADLTHQRSFLDVDHPPSAQGFHAQGFNQTNQARGFDPAESYEGRGHESDHARSDSALPLGHPLESFIEQERARAGMSRPDPDRLSMDILRSAIERRSGGGGEPGQAWSLQDEPSPLTGLQEALRAAATQGDGLMQGLSRPGKSTAV